MNAIEQARAPQSIDAEQAVLGCMLIERSACERALELLKEGDFYLEAHQTIFAALRTLAQSSRDVDLLGLSDLLSTAQELANVGGDLYLLNLTEMPSSTASLESYAQIVAAKSTQRKLMAACTVIAQSALSAQVADVPELVGKAQAAMLAVSSDAGEKPFCDLGAVVSGAVDEIAQAQKDGPSKRGVLSGFSDIDWMTNGFDKGDLIILGARPSMGKTALGVQMALHAAAHGHLAAIFSLEMGQGQIAKRLLSMESGVNATLLKNGMLSEQDMQAIRQAATRIGTTTAHICDKTSLSVMEIRSRVRRLKAERGAVGLVVIDYLQIIQTTTAQGVNRATEIAQSARQLKAMAREMDCPVLALAQVGRAVEGRPDKRPQLSDLKESGAIEEAADVVMLLYRGAYYERGESLEQSAEIEEAELLVAKNRNGQTGKCTLGFLPRQVKFSDVETQRSDPHQGRSAMPYRDSDAPEADPFADDPETINYMRTLDPLARFA